MLDENQKLASSLASVLNAIPDPSGISQGSAGAVTLLSKISGTDKCTFSIFSSQKDAVNYKNTGDQQNACLVYPTKISKMAARLTLQNSSCLKSDTKYLYFGFESSNLLMKQKIILEVVPWVNKKASRGWTLDAKQKFINNCKLKLKSNKQTINPDLYCNCFLDKTQQAYSVYDLQQLTSAERNSADDKFAKLCLAETGALTNSFNQLRADAKVAMAKARYADAISKYSEIILNGEPVVADYSNIGYSYILTKQYLKAIKFLEVGQQLDESDLRIKSGLAHAYLLSGNTKVAKKIYSKYDGQNVDEQTSWNSMIRSDFDLFRKASLPDDNFRSVLRALK